MFRKMDNRTSNKKICEAVCRMNYSSLSDGQLRALSAQLKGQAQSGADPDLLLPEAFALVREAARRTIGMYPYEVQVLGGIALHQGNIAELQTGEGKTLTAVMPAYLNALTGKGVHILTFNEYLACRDAQWMGPVYEFLGISVGSVKEGMQTAERQKAYGSDITYVTAKEAGFDHLRDFLCTCKDSLVHRPFHYAIVDEADSILIDEARTPLVIAGEAGPAAGYAGELALLAKKLRPGIDFVIDGYGDHIHLTETGILQAEKSMGCGNLYDTDNMTLLAGLNCALHAELLLQRDRDYVVSNGKIEMVDTLTGRIAEKRQWPELLQSAVEAKEGLKNEAGGIILGSIAMQHYLSLYSRLAGMTGTAGAAASEFREYYGMDVVTIPTNRKCIRIDYPDLIFTHQEAKQKALVAEIKRAHGTGQPILIGTGSIEESETLAKALSQEGIPCTVLNAKNDEMEAAIIKKAGEAGAVTVSTNMAGRGVDIRLGGEQEQERDRVAALGGLYVIGTNRQESRRMDEQLRGRAGRQGDPGESRFIISLEDELAKKLNAAKLIPARRYPAKQEGSVDDPVVRHAMDQGQRFVEGYNSDLRVQLWKYGFIVEQQRRIIHNKRMDVLLDRVPLNLLREKAPERYQALQADVGEKVLKAAEKQLALHFISRCWAEYLEHIAEIREGIHLVAIAGKNPIHELNRLAVEAFQELLERIDTEILQAFNEIELTPDGIDLEKEGLQSPGATWTYLVSDSPDQFGNGLLLIKAVSNMVSKPLFSIRSVYHRLFGKGSAY